MPSVSVVLMGRCRSEADECEWITSDIVPNSSDYCPFVSHCICKNEYIKPSLLFFRLIWLAAAYIPPD